VLTVIGVVGSLYVMAALALTGMQVVPRAAD
jgi:hypothetical protein